MTGRVNLYAKSLWTSQEHVKTGSVGDYVTATYFVEVTMLSFSPIARARSCARIEQSVLSANSRAGGRRGGGVEDEEGLTESLRIKLFH